MTQKTNRLHFSTRTIAMVLSIVMLIGSIATGSMLSTFAAYMKDAAAKSDAVTQAATEGGDIALNAIPSEDAAVDNADEKPDLSDFEENEIVRGIKKDFAETAAAADFAPTGWNSSTDRLHLRVGSTWTDYYFNSSGVTTFTIANDNTTIEFELNFNGTVYKLHSSQLGFSAAGIHSEDGEERLAKSDGSSTYSVSGVYADTYTVTLTTTVNNGEVKFKINGTDSSGGDTSDENYYVYGKYFGGWENWTTDSITSMSKDATTGQYYARHTVEASEDRFRLYAETADKHYSPSSSTELTLGTPVAARDNSDSWHNEYFGLNSNITTGTDILIWWNPTSKNVWVTLYKDDVVGSVALTADKYTLSATDETVTFTATPDGTIKDNNLTYKLYRKGNATAVATKTTTTGGPVTFDPVTSQFQSQDYYVTVQKTGDTTTYNEVTSNEVNIRNTNDAYKPDYTVTIKVGDSDKTLGVVSAKSTYNSGSAATTPSTATATLTVKEGYSVTITATPGSGNQFKGWTGTTETASSFTVSVYEDITVTADFALTGYQVISDGHTPKDNSMLKMRELPNGTYISNDVFNSGYWFKIYRNEDGLIGKTSHESGYNLTDYGSFYTARGAGKEAEVSWNNDSNKDWYSDYSFHWTKSGSSGYIVYDPKTNSVWVTGTDADNPGVEVTAKNGTIRSQDGLIHTSDFGVTTVTAVTTDGTTISATEAGAYNNKAVRYALTAAQVNKGVKMTVKTVVNSDYADDGYYVKGFVVSGHEETYSVLWQEFNEDGTEKSTYTDRAKIHGATGVEEGRPWNEFTLEISGYPTEPIEITPIYFIKENKSGDNVRFYVDSFAGDVKENWGGTLAVDVYGTYRPFGEYPGQPMINYNGRYLMDIPRGVQGITMNNYVWDHVHSNLFYGTDGVSDSGLGDKIKDHNYQTYDFNDFEYINKKLSSLNKDEDIIFSFRYKHDANHNTQANSNLADCIYYNDSTSQHSGQASNYGTNYGTMTATHEAMYQFENLTDFYDNRVDLFGNLVDLESNATKAAYNPVRVVSNGYDLNKAGDFGTAWAIYTPASYTGSAGTYTLKDVVGGLGNTYQDTTANKRKSNYQSESFFIDPYSEARVRFKYDNSIRDNTTLASTKYNDAQGNETILGYWQRKFREQNNNSASYPALIADLAGVPVEITYEYEVKDGRSNGDIDDLTGEGQIGYRSDGRWYYSSSDQLVTAHTIVEYADKEGGTYVRDYFQGNSIDYKQSGYLPAEHTGLSTGIQAYFTNDGEKTIEGKTFSNTSGYTEANGITDGEYTFDLKTIADPDGNYTFAGWYLYTNGTYSFITKDMSFKSEATANDVYVARYYKTPSGTLTISHDLDPDSTGTGTCKVKVDVVDGNDTTVYSEGFNEGKPIKLGNSIVRVDKNYTIKITLETDMGAFSKFNKFWLNYIGVHTNLVYGSVPDDATFNQTASNGQKTYTFTYEFNVQKIFDTNGAQRYKALPFYSLIDKPEFNYKLKFTYPAYNNSSYGKQSFTVKDYFTDDELNEYMVYDNGELSFNTAASASDEIKRTFINNHAPYENNFQKTIKYDTYVVPSRSWDSSTSTFSMDITLEQEQETLDVTFHLPYQPKDRAAFEPNETDNKVYYQEPVDYKPTTKIYGRNWYTTTGRVDNPKPDQNMDGVKFVKAPLILADSNGDDKYYFLYWSVYTAAKYNQASVEYTRCYDPEFNLALFQDCIIQPIYGNAFASNMPNAPSKWNDYGRFDPDVQRGLDSSNGITITFLENSRNQYNLGNYGDGANAATKMANSRKGGGDRIYSDFLISYNNIAGNVTLRDLPAGSKKAGLIIQAVDYMDKDADGKYITSAEHYRKDKGTNIDSDTQTKLNSLITGNAESGFAKSEFDVRELDNKNRIQYYYSLANKSHTTDTSKYVLDDTLQNKYKYFRAYAYIADYNSGSYSHIQISPTPVYFTIYDMATIENGTFFNNN